MKAVMYGAGNIGRGFIGALLSQAGYQVTFIDVDKALVAELNARGQYPLRILSSDGHEDHAVDKVSAIDGNDVDQVAGAIAEADIMATAVGANILKFIAPNIAKGIQMRFSQTDKPLDILICENLMDADQVLKQLIGQALPEADRALFDERIGLVETSIGRMVPVQTDEMKDGDPLRVCVERYGFLPVDKAAFKGNVPSIGQLVPYSPFGFYIKRKLYVHNTGHAICAYLGLHTGAEYIYQAVDDPYIRLLAQGAMEESMEALLQQYDVAYGQIRSNIDDLLQRFTNRALGDTCARVGNDTRRKLAANDRLVGAAGHCLARGVLPGCIAVGIAAALYRHLQQAGLLQTQENALEVLKEVSGLTPDNELTPLVLQPYNQLATGTTPRRLFEHAIKTKHESKTDVV